MYYGCHLIPMEDMDVEGKRFNVEYDANHDALWMLQVIFKALVTALDKGRLLQRGDLL